MRVLQIVTRPQRRGAEIFALDLCRELERRDHPTRLVHLYSSPEPQITIRPQDRAMGKSSDHWTERLPGFQSTLLGRLTEAIDEFAPDVVQVNGSRSVKYGSLLRRRRGNAGWALVYRSIGTPSDWLRSRLHRSLYRYLVISGVDGMVAVSDATLRSLEEAYRPVVPTVVIPRGVDLEGFVPQRSRGEMRRHLATPPDRPVLLFVGSLTAEKRPDRLLRVASEAVRRFSQQRPDVQAELWVVGDGPLREELERSAVTAPTNLAVRTFGAREDVAAFMTAADILLLVSDTEGTPGVVLEAAAARLTVAALAVGGVGELVADGETGVLAPPGDEAALSTAVATLLDHPERRRALGVAARRRVEERFSLTAVTDRFLAFYRVVVEHRRSKS